MNVGQKKSGVRDFLSPYFHGQKKEVESAAFFSNKLFKRYTAAVAFFFIVGSFTPIDGLTNDAYAAHTNAMIESASLDGTLLADNDGYLTKINPQTNIGDRSTMHDRLVHTVAAGETVSTIAQEYGLKTSTILWENGIGNANSLRTGQKLLIPPVDGVNHKVAKGETVEKVAKTYSVDAEAIKRQNNLVASTLTVGQEIYIPGGKPIVNERSTPARVGTSSRVDYVSGAILPGSNDVPIGGKPFIFPTRGKLTQGFRKGHYAFDIADSSKPPIWAAAAGTVVKASSGTYGGGYGNHIIIDHGNGLKTLYAHMEYLSVKVGDQVTQGQVIGKQGRTGRVYGRTGIHLHFEVIKNGVKQVPSNYY